MTHAQALLSRPFTWSQAEQAGVTRRQLTALVQGGEVRRVLAGVYQPAHLADSLLNRALAAALVMRPFSVMVDRTAAWLHGVDTFAYHDLDLLPPLEMYVVRDHARVRRSGVRGGERQLTAADVMRVHGVRVTTPLRTDLDLACRLHRRDALASLDGFMRIHGITPTDLRTELPRYRRRRGVVQLRRLIPLADGRAESPGESWTRMVMHDAGLPPPELQIWVCDRGRPRYRLDLGYPQHRVCVEYDGVEYHDSVAQRRTDARRREWLRTQGWTVIVVTKDDFDTQSADRWLGQVWAALRSA